jgi:hypothetical protein
MQQHAPLEHVELVDVLIVAGFVLFVIFCKWVKTWGDWKDVLMLTGAAILGLIAVACFLFVAVAFWSDLQTMSPETRLLFAIFCGALRHRGQAL